MTKTPRLSLPLIAAGQSQKHVTHNDALFMLDTTTALHLLALEQSTPPTSPTEGDAYSLGLQPTGAWQGEARKVAVFDGVAWNFATPSKGWTATVGVQSTFHVFDGNNWKNSGAPLNLVVETLGVGASADANNAAVLKIENMLLTSPDASDAIRLKINRKDDTDLASVLFQTDFMGTAEIGLLGNSGFGIKTSTNGNLWRETLKIDPVSAVVSFPMGVNGRSGAPDLLLNGHFQINQRKTPTGTANSGVYAFDRWRAGTSGAVWTTPNGALRLNAGSLRQIVEPDTFGEKLAVGDTLRLSAEGLTEGSLNVTVGAQTVTLTSTSPRAEIVLAQAVTGNFTVTIAPVSGAVTLSSLRLHAKRPWLGEAVRRPDEDEALCKRYYFKTLPEAIAPGIAASSAPGTVSTSLGLYYTRVPFPQNMRRTPSVQAFNPNTGLAGSWYTGGGTNVVPTIDPSTSGVTLYGGGAESGTLVFGHIVADAEPLQ